MFKLSLTTKIILIPLAILTVVFASGYVVYTKVQNTENVIEVDITASSVPGLEYIKEIENHTLNCRLMAYQYLYRETIHAKNSNESVTKLENEKKELYENVKKYEGTIVEKVDRDNFEKLKVAYKRYFDSLDVLLSLDTASANASSQNSATIYANEVEPCVNEAVRYNTEQLHNAITQLNGNMERMKESGVVGTITILIISILLSYIIGRSISKPIKQAAELVNLNTSSVNDISKIIHTGAHNSSGSIEKSNKNSALSLNSMQTIATAIKQTNVNAASVATAANQMTANVSTVATSIEEMTASIKEISQQTERTSTISSQAAAASAKAAAELDKMVKSTEEVSKALVLIQNIASQTNLLALNATIEAARAGAQGKGFAVVAGEVKNLANKAAETSREMERIIREIKENAETSNIAVKDISTTINELNKFALSLSASMQEQSATIQTVAENSSQLNAAVGDVSRSINEINNATKDVSDTTQITLKATEETSYSIKEVGVIINEADASSKKLIKAVEELNEAKQKLNTIITG